MSADTLFNFLQSKEAQDKIDDYIDFANHELADNITIKKDRDYPLGDDYYIDYLEYDFDENDGEKEFFDIVAYNIKEMLLSDEQSKFVETEKINDIELCGEYANVLFDLDAIIDIAIKNHDNMDGYYD